MLFCIMANYTPQAINSLMADPDMNRASAITNLLEAAGGKLVSMYSMGAEGPGVLVIFDVPDPNVAPAIVGIAKASGSVEDVRLIRLMSQDEVKGIRKNAARLKSAYKAPHA